MKIANIFLGLGTSTSKYPCPWCEVSKDKFNIFTQASMKMKLRDLRSIRKNAAKYQLAASAQKSRKNSAQPPSTVVKKSLGSRKH